MSAGVADSAVFVFLATAGGLRKPNVRHEVACAVQRRRPVVVLVEACGPSLDELLREGEAYEQADAAGDAAAGRLHLDAQGLRDFAQAALGGRQLSFHRDAQLVGETLPALLVALQQASGGGKGMAAALSPRAGASDVAIVSGTTGALQALYLAEELGRDRELVVHVVPGGASEAIARAAVDEAPAVVIVLSAGAWGEAGFAAAASAAVGTVSAGGLEKRLALVHEKDADFGGAPFGAVMAATPKALRARLYSRGTASVFPRRGAEARAVVGEVLERIKPAKHRAFHKVAHSQQAPRARPNSSN